MKIIFLPLIVFGMTLGARAQISTNQPSRMKIQVVCSGIGGGGIFAGPDDPGIIFPGNGGEEHVTSRGFEHDLQWVFVGMNGPTDVWRFTFTRMTNEGSSSKTTTSKEVQFNGKKTIVFRDDLHSVVMESPGTQDSTPAPKP